MLPAVIIDSHVFTESDDILIELEAIFGALSNHSMCDANVVRVRRLERQLFRSWCQWLCKPAKNREEEERGKEEFVRICGLIEESLELVPESP
jgi:glutathione S-transferase